MIETELYNFVQVWNTHRIRPQKDHPYAVTGRPSELYYDPNIRNYGVPIVQGTPEYETLRTMLEPIEAAEINIDDFLTPETEAWCREQLEEMNFDPVLHTDEERRRPYITSYIELKRRISEHIRRGAEPHLQLVDAPRRDIEDEYVRTLLPLRTLLFTDTEQRRILQGQFLKENLPGQAMPADLRESLNRIIAEDAEVEVVND